MRAAVVTLLVVVGLCALLAAWSLISAWPLTPDSTKHPYEIAFVILGACCFALAGTIWHRSSRTTPN
jgi:hypothetical protein